MHANATRVFPRSLLSFTLYFSSYRISSFTATDVSGTYTHDHPWPTEEAGKTNRNSKREKIN
ncbi:hypothetical protein, unlikely [Trypanosoma brucei brucei TREU927]|uniref:Uncharacterized protein n=1 Tax=Trypanosoma brucei brucei (strain 927/4 GUTat10.1) TaxID=185431 RepID=Q4GYQ7_TRYB2|nr:hypothetical protein, unlikely [Trypanosoma brucei brucei TREU927]CAJ16527.1 hypothetical protein, unlikely [Trypanosoma brucei brucei TREU927]